MLVRQPLPRNLAPHLPEVSVRLRDDMVRPDDRQVEL